MLGGGWRSLIAMDFYVYHFQYFKSKCLIYSFARLQEYPINPLSLLLQIPKNSMRWRWLPKHHKSNVFYWTTMVTSHPLEVLKVIEIYLQIVPTDFYFKCILVFGLHTNVLLVVRYPRYLNWLRSKIDLFQNDPYGKSKVTSFKLHIDLKTWSFEFLN